MENKPAPVPPDGQLLIYQDGGKRIQVRIDGKTVWLTQRLIAELYQVSVKTVNEHLSNIYSENELDPSATIRKFRIVQTEGARQVSRINERLKHPTDQPTIGLILRASDRRGDRGGTDGSGEAKAGADRRTEKERGGEMIFLREQAGKHDKIIPACACLCTARGQAKHSAPGRWANLACLCIPARRQEAVSYGG